MNEKPSISSDEMYEGDSVGDDAYVNTASNLNNGEGDPVIQKSQIFRRIQKLRRLINLRLLEVELWVAGLQ